MGIVNQQRMLGWDPVMLTSGKHYAPGPDREQINGWEFLRTPMPAGLVSNLPAFRELRIISDLGKRLDEIVPQVKPDVLHAHSPVLNAFAAIRAGHRYGIPVVYEIRAFWEDAHVSAAKHLKPNLRYRTVRRLETYAMHRVDAIATICRGLSADIVARGIPREKITVVPNAVDRTAFTGPAAPDQQLAARLGVLGKTVIGFFGSFYLYEGLHILLRSLAELRRYRSDISVLLVGGGPEEGSLRELANQLGVNDSVVFAGRVPHENIYRYYDLADLFVFPRLSMRLTELVTPLKPLEAMAQERIVVASDVGGHRELIRHGETGYLFPSDIPDRLTEGVIAALDDQPRWPRIRALALDFVDSERSWTRSVALYAEVYARASHGKLVPSVVTVTG
jgi:PEP-CTERM/exosortase A-associated glycosyltransferase